jgi:ABC-type antimicrobial peptide transport system permease subunit
MLRSEQDIVVKEKEIKQERIKFRYLLWMSVKQLKVKKTRTVITIGGIGLGIATIVFLVSIGFGLQNIIISRVATSQDLRQADVSVQVGSNLTLTNKTINNFKGYKHVTKVLPLISVVGQVNYQNSLSDVVVYGVTTDYLYQSDLSPEEGKFFQSSTISQNTIQQPRSFLFPPIQALEAVSTAKPSTVITTPTPTPLPSNFIYIPSLSSNPQEAQTQTVAIGSNALKQAVVNESMLQLLGITKTNAVGHTFSVTFIVTADLTSNNEKIQSLPVTYTIDGVIPDDQTPVFYVAISDLQSQGITQYSQLKIVVDNQNDLASVRKQIEAGGYSTNSAADTVAQITNIFQIIRIILFLFGAIALFVATLGMFNTLTISLMERTKEIGLMRAIGMESGEVRKVFLAESVLMSTLGGFVGVVMGFVIGKLFGIILSLILLKNATGYIDISSIPVIFAGGIVGFSFFVGFLTGIYPSIRATRVSAIDALRYE